MEITNDDAIFIAHLLQQITNISICEILQILVPILENSDLIQLGWSKSNQNYIHLQMPQTLKKYN